MAVIMGISNEPLGANFVLLGLVELFHARAALFFGSPLVANCALPEFWGTDLNY